MACFIEFRKLLDANFKLEMSFTHVRYTRLNESKFVESNPLANTMNTSVFSANESGVVQIYLP